MQNQICICICCRINQPAMKQGGCICLLKQYPVESCDDYRIEKYIKELGKKYNIKEIGVDRWNATQMIQNLEDEGFTMVPIGQGYKDMSPPTKEFYKLILEGKIAHGGNPVLRWMAGNVVVETDAAENIKPTKAKSTEKNRRNSSRDNGTRQSNQKQGYRKCV